MTNHISAMSQIRRWAPRPRRAGVVIGLALSGLLLAACGDDGTNDPATGTATSDGQTGTSDLAADEQTAAEAATRTPRIVVTYDGGIQVLDATTLDVVGDIELEGFNRLNPAGDERHLFVSTAGGFRLLDTGTWGEPHGDHAHYYTADPVLTDVTVDADKPGHVVVHDGRTALFDDGTGEVVVFDSGESADPDREARELTTPSAHHGVAVELSDGTVVVSEGEEDARTGIRVLDASGNVIAESDQCPGVHGEAVAADEAVVIGCENGALLYTGGEITKVTSPDAYGRIGNQAGSENSPIVLGDYKTDPNAELERPTRVSLIDTRTGSLAMVDLPSSYTFRSLARGEDGSALVLGTDGQIHVIDPEAAEVVRSIPVIEPWEEPLEWQEARPTLTMLDGSAYVTDPSTNTIHAVDIPTGKVWVSAPLDVTPNEISGVTGAAVEGVSAEHGESDVHGESDEHGESDGHSHEDDHGSEDDHGH